MTINTIARARIQVQQLYEVRKKAEEAPHKIAIIIANIDDIYYNCYNNSNYMLLKCGNMEMIEI